MVSSRFQTQQTLSNYVITIQVEKYLEKNRKRHVTCVVMNGIKLDLYTGRENLKYNVHHGV